jgi:uncharacterized protein
MNYLKFLGYAVIAAIIASCSSYNNKIASYSNHLQAGNFDKALSSLESNKFLKRSRNQVLYHLEAGRLYRLQNNFAKSNEHLNAADNLMQSGEKSFKEIAISNILNPGQENYRGDDHEKFLMHFYKTLNYAALGAAEDVAVEARRITLSNNIQEQKFTKDSLRYSQDAFSMNIQGMAYEIAGDFNNAFIAYRNALELFEKNKGNYYGIATPQQLIVDLVRMAKRMGFDNDVARYAKNLHANSFVTNDTAGSLILFFEEGKSPVKAEKNFILTSAGSKVNGFAYVDQFGLNNTFNFNNSNFGISDDDLSKFRILKVALPYYQVLYNNSPANIMVSANKQQYQSQPIQDLNTITLSVTREKFLRDMGKAVARQITKKLLEEGTELGTEALAKRNKKIDSDTTLTDEQKKAKKKERAKDIANVAGLATNVFTSLMERADTRYWQSLPAYIHYVRVPLEAGENNITVQTPTGLKTITVMGNKQIQMQSLVL